jgi:hypothetical protein
MEPQKQMKGVLQPRGESQSKNGANIEKVELRYREKRRNRILKAIYEYLCPAMSGILTTLGLCT